MRCLSCDGVNRVRPPRRIVASLRTRYSRPIMTESFACWRILPPKDALRPMGSSTWKEINRDRLSGEAARGRSPRETVTQQRGTFSLQGACAYVLYWAMEDGHTLPAAGALYQSDKLSPADCQRVSAVLQKIVREGRIAADGEQYKKIAD